MQLNSKNTAKIPKKTWNLINEAINKETTYQKITKNTTNGITTTNTLEIANNSNNYFSSIGKSISDSVNETNVKAEALVPEGDVPEFELGSIKNQHRHRRPFSKFITISSDRNKLTTNPYF